MLKSIYVDISEQPKKTELQKKVERLITKREKRRPLKKVRF